MTCLNNSGTHSSRIVSNLLSQFVCIISDFGWAGVDFAMENINETRFFHVARQLWNYLRKARASLEACRLQWKI
jgi:hypothetical protein